jgi:uncharacterized UBP type Zn finger protein
LSFYPSSHIDISDFVEVWRGIDNETIDPQVPQDAGEFLSLLLDLMNDKVPNLPDVFRGTIKHTMVDLSDPQYTSTSVETFFTFPLDIAGNSCVDNSFRAFLDPDQFEVNHMVGRSPRSVLRRSRQHPKFSSCISSALNTTLPSIDEQKSIATLSFL